MEANINKIDTPSYEKALAEYLNEGINYEAFGSIVKKLKDADILGQFTSDTFFYGAKYGMEKKLLGLLTSEGTNTIVKTKDFILFKKNHNEMLDHIKNLLSDMNDLLSELEDRGFEWQQAGYYESAKILIKEAIEIL